MPSTFTGVFVRGTVLFISLLYWLVGCAANDRGPLEPTDAPPEIRLMEDEPTSDGGDPGTEATPDMPAPDMDEVALDDPCMGIDYLGSCEGAVATWCQDGALAQRDCGSEGMGCGWVDDSTGYFCTTETATEPDPLPEPTEECGTAIEREQLAETNAERVAAGLDPLICDPALTLAARLHSEDMCRTGHFDHDSADGRTFVDRIREQGVTYRAAAENIAHGQITASEVHIDWMNSPGHRANIMNGLYGRVGIGYAPCGGRPYWTQDFAD
jgi:uncharacterized protein YkwD